MKLTREEVLRLMRQASGGILTQVAEDPRCGYEIKVEELQTFAELLQAKNDSDHVAVTSAEPETSLKDDPHPPSRHCMCDDCKPSFETDFLGRPAQTDELALAQLGEFAGQVGQAHLAALVDELRPDADRFRFLVNQDIENDFPRGGLFIGKIPDNCALTGPEAIAEIDKAMNALQTGISSPSHRPNEKDVVGEGK